MINIKNIGIIIRNFEENDKKFIGIREDLFRVFYQYDVNVIGIPISNNFEKTKELVGLCDGIVLSGGDDFTYQDFLLVDYLYENDIPTLGICLGMQTMAKYFSDIDEIDIQNHLSKEKYVHCINIKKNSLLHDILQQEKILVNSRHKSAIIQTDLNISALSDDYVIEAVEDTSKKFFLGVEWHPESLNDEFSQKLFDYFVNLK